MVKYFTNTINSKLIKNILHNTPLPIYDTVREGDYILSPFIYINRCNIFKCTKSGIFTEDAEVQVITHFSFGEYYPKFTEKFMSDNLYYDTQTHKQLGRYLRAYRDCYNIDLMPFYNCWCNQYISNFFVTDRGVVKGDNSPYKVAMVPIRFNKKYTIAADSSSAVMIAPIYQENNQLIPAWSGSRSFDLTTDLCSRNGYANVHKQLSCSFKQPFTIEVQNRDGDSNAVVHQRNEKYLYLLIQFMSTVNTTLIVLEGDYTDLGCTEIYNSEKVLNVEYEGNTVSEKNIITPVEWDKMMLSNLDLLQLSSKEQRPYSNRLIEYLLQNVITSRDEVSLDIKIAQRGRMKQTGVWDNNLRRALYRDFMNSKHSRKIDITGYVDKDVENSIMKGYM